MVVKCRKGWAFYNLLVKWQSFNRSASQGCDLLKCFSSDIAYFPLTSTGSKFLICFLEGLLLLTASQPHYVRQKEKMGMDWGGIPFPQLAKVSEFSSGKVLFPEIIDLFYGEGSGLCHYNIPLPSQSHREFFSEPHFENMVELMGEKPMKVLGFPLRLQPLVVFLSHTSMHSDSSNS